VLTLRNGFVDFREPYHFYGNVIPNELKIQKQKVKSSFRMK